MTLIRSLRADDGFKAVEIPSGTHHVAFVYRPVRAFAGIAVSLATLAVAALLLYSVKCRMASHPVP